jgi:hypothetical protein
VIGGAVLVGAISAAAGRPSATLRDVVDRGRPGLAACYATALAAAPGLGGDGALHVTIEPDGHVSRSVFAGGEALASAMAICLGAAARQWTFPVASDPARIDVALTFAP